MRIPSGSEASLALQIMQQPLIIGRFPDQSGTQRPQLIHGFRGQTIRSWNATKKITLGRVTDRVEGHFDQIEVKSSLRPVSRLCLVLLAYLPRPVLEIGLEKFDGFK